LNAFAALLRSPSLTRAARRRLHGRLIPIAQTAAAAVAAWYLASLIVSDPRPAFASIAAVIAVGATYGQRGHRAFQLVGGVVVGITAADLIIHAIGIGAPQMGLMVVLAMLTAVLLGGGELLVVEAAVSAILLAALEPGAGAGFSPNRILEALIGGASALAVSALLLPPDPALTVGRAVQAVFGELGRTLEHIADALAARDAAGVQAALDEARAADRLIGEARLALATSRESARLAPPGRARAEHVGRYDRSLPQIDFAVRDTRMLARHALRLTRAGVDPGELPESIRALSRAVWELAGAYDDERRAHEARWLAVVAAAQATELEGAGADLTLSALVSQVRSTAVDLVRAAELAGGGPRRGGGVAAPTWERPTEELLLEPISARS
jgi:uncharacterized membrane protein YccC